MGLSVGEIIFILAVILLFFGASKLPQLAKSLGAALSEFKKGVKEGGLEAEETPKKAEKKSASKKK